MNSDRHYPLLGQHISLRVGFIEVTLCSVVVDNQIRVEVY